jgi:Bacterial PH domain
MDMRTINPGDNPHPNLTLTSDEPILFDIENGTCALCLEWSTIHLLWAGPCVYCCALEFMKSQQVTFEDAKRIHYRSECCYNKVDRMIPFDRIQDVDVVQNCCQRCYGVHVVTVSTAGSAEGPTAIVAPTDPYRLRDRLAAIREHHTGMMSPQGGLGGGGIITREPNDMVPLLRDEIHALNATASRIEKLLEKGILELHQSKSKESTGQGQA